MELLILAVLYACAMDAASGWFVCPQRCVCVQYRVDCSRIALQDMPTYLPQHVEELDMSNNDLHYLPSVLYIPQTLLHLDLSGNQLHNIPDKSLEQLWMLRSLNLSGNKIYRVADISAAVRQAKKLTRLDVSGNPLREIGGEKCPRHVEEYNQLEALVKSGPGGPKTVVVNDDGVLRNDYLSELDMSDCDLTRINMCSFVWLANLTRLFLSKNPIKQLSQFKSPTLQHLELSNCGVLYITPNAFEELPSLQYLDVSQNPSLKLHTPFSRSSGSRTMNNGNGYMSKSLLYLDASYCGLMELFVASFPNLRHCSFKGNLIRDLPSRIFYQNRQLLTIDLSENLISSTTYLTFIGGETVTTLDLSLNFISEFQQATFSHMLSMTRLNVSRNPLKSIANISAPSLNILDASDCDINELSPFSFFNLPEITILNLSNNPLENLPDELASFRLASLDLSYCRLSTVKPTTFKNLPALKQLDLRGNRLTNPFRREVMASMDAIRYLRLKNNPWQCDCNGTRSAEFLKFAADRSGSDNNEPDDGESESDDKSTGNKVDTQRTKELTCRRPDTYLELPWTKACQHLNVRRANGPERQWMAFIVTFAVVSSVLIVLLVLRQNLMSDENAARSQQPTQDAVGANVNDDELNAALLATSRPVRSPIADILQLPTYEEAILLPKPPPIRLDETSVNGTREVATWMSTENDLYGGEYEDGQEVAAGDDADDNCSLCNRQNIQNTRAVSSTSL